MLCHTMMQSPTNSNSNPESKEVILRTFAVSSPGVRTQPKGTFSIGFWTFNPAPSEGLRLPEGKITQLHTTCRTQKLVMNWC